MKKEQNQQELLFKLSMFEQQTQQLQQQLQAVKQAIIEMSQLEIGLEELIGSKNKEILAPIGKGIFAQTILLSEKLIVDIGGKNLVKKSIPDTKKIIQEQTKKLEEIQVELNINLEKINQEFTELILKAQEKENY